MLEGGSVLDGGSVVVVDGGTGSRAKSQPLAAVQNGEGYARALVLLPSSGVTTHDFSSLTIWTPLTTIGVRIIVHV